MALKFKIGATAYEGLPADVKKEYKQQGSDYVLDLDGYEDPAELRRARDHEKEQAAEAKRQAAAEKKRADTAEGKVSDLEKSGAKVDEAVAAKDKEWQTKYDKDVGERDTALTGLRTSVQDNSRKSLAEGIAKEISTSPSLLLPHLLNRIGSEINDKNEIVTYIKDVNGQKTAGTVEDLKKEVLKTKEFAPILRATQATGGGGAPARPGGGGAPQSGRPGLPANPNAPVDLTKLNPHDFAAQITAKREAEGRA